MSELTLLLLRIGFLLLLWFFVFAVVYSLRADLFGMKVRKLPAEAAAAMPAPTQAPASAPASAPGTEHWLPGIPQDATAASLLITNPGSDRATVQVAALGATAAYQPEGGSDVSVPAHTTVAVELADSLAGEATGLHVTSDVDVAVGLATGTGGDLAFAAPVPPSTTLGAFVPGRGVLQITNPGDVDASVGVTTEAGDVEGQRSVEEYRIQAGTTLAVPLLATDPEPLVVSVTSGTDVFGAVVDTTDGASIATQSSTAERQSAPVDAEIVPTLR